ncbi:uncharacterized protein [Panulirus ornatus]|uniref:uncharacterized protein n=1 Tax=Panulirus ornatus TaxID=150431 RepID=UPI003A8A0D3F
MNPGGFQILAKGSCITYTSIGQGLMYHLHKYWPRAHVSPTQILAKGSCITNKDIGQGLSLKHMEEPTYPQVKIWGLSLTYTLGAFTSRSMRLPATDRLRVASLTLLFMGFVVAITFSGNLTAFMTTRSVEAAIRTLSELAQSHLAIVGFGNYWSIVFAGSQNPSIRSLSHKYKSVYDTLPYFREAAEKRQTALIENRNHLEFIQKRKYTTRRGESPLRIQEECLATYGVGAVLARHSPLAPYVDKAIHHMQAGGLTDKFFREVLTQDLDDSHHQQEDGEASWLDLHDQILIPSGPQVLTVEHVQGAFIVLGVGCLAASLSLVGEVMMVAGLCLTS